MLPVRVAGPLNAIEKQTRGLAQRSKLSGQPPVELCHNASARNGRLQVMIESELEAALSRPRYGRRPKTPDENAQGPSGITGHRHGHRSRSLLGTFGRVEIALPRARLDTAEGKTTEWRSTALRVYQRRTRQADSLIAGAYLAGTNTRRVRRALAAVFGGAVSKSLPSRRRGIR